MWHREDIDERRCVVAEQSLQPTIWIPLHNGTGKFGSSARSFVTTSNGTISPPTAEHTYPKWIKPIGYNAKEAVRNEMMTLLLGQCFDVDSSLKPSPG
jgi:hypothetical protein